MNLNSMDLKTDVCVCDVFLQASDGETHTHAAAGRRRPVCEILSGPQAFSRLSVGLHRQTLLHGHAEGKGPPVT